MYNKKKILISFKHVQSGLKKRKYENIYVHTNSVKK